MICTETHAHEASIRPVEGVAHTAPASRALLPAYCSYLSASCVRVTAHVFTTRIRRGSR
jgi:hypothetical protein